MSFNPKVLDSIILLAPSSSPGDESQGPWPADCSLLYHSLLREELVGGNVGGIELKYPADNEHGLVTGVLYWHGRGFLRNFLGHEFTSLSKQCGTFRYKTFPGLRNAVVQLMRALYDGTPEATAAARQVFSLFRIEFNVRALTFDEARANLREFLRSIGCALLLSRWEDQRVQAFQTFVQAHGCKVRCVLFHTSA